METIQNINQNLADIHEIMACLKAMSANFQSVIIKLVQISQVSNYELNMGDFVSDATDATRDAKRENAELRDFKK
ncbi:MAG: hypothetical protein ACSLEM_06670 [Candidatus Malihini olakiniferum]